MLLRGCGYAYHDGCLVQQRWTLEVRSELSAHKEHLAVGIEAGAAAGFDDMTEYFGQVQVDYRFQS